MKREKRVIASSSSQTGLNSSCHGRISSKTFSKRSNYGRHEFGTASSQIFPRLFQETPNEDSLHIEICKLLGKLLVISREHGLQ